MESPNLQVLDLNGQGFSCQGLFVKCSFELVDQLEWTEMKNWGKKSKQ